MGRAAPDALDLAGRALRARDLSRRALAAKLARAGVSEADRAATIERLVEAGVLDDRRSAVARAEALASRGYGDSFIDARLGQEGIEADDRRAALAQLAPEPGRAALAAARAGSSDPRRVGSLLARRGFSPDAVEGVVARLLDERDGAALR